MSGDYWFPKPIRVGLGTAMKSSGMGGLDWVDCPPDDWQAVSAGFLRDHLLHRDDRATWLIVYFKGEPPGRGNWKIRKP
jgi:hypothetical protein